MTYEWADKVLVRYVNVNVIVYGMKWILIIFCSLYNKNIYYLIEYSGYGDFNDNDTECSEANIYDDIECVYKYITTEKNIDPKTIILYGRSLGSGPTCYLAEHHVVGG